MLVVPVLLFLLIVGLALTSLRLIGGQSWQFYGWIGLAVSVVSACCG